MNTANRRVLKGFCMALMTLTLPAVAQQMPQTTTERIKGESTVKTQQLHGTVVLVEGNRLVVRMSTGEIRQFDVPESRIFLIDGKEMHAGELKPGTKLTATVTTTTTPVTQRTTTVGTGKVWFVSGNTVILTLPNNENRMYKVQDWYRFTVAGKPASVHDLRKGMTVSAQKIVEEPNVEFASNTAVVGSAPPPPKPVRAEVARARPAPMPAPAAAPAPQPAPEPVAKAAPPTPAKLPKTGSPLPLVGVLGLLFVGSSFILRILRRT